MTGPVPIVEALLPEELASEGVEREARRSFREDGRVEGDDAFEDQGVGFPLHGCGRAEMQRASCVGRAVEVLGA